MGQILEIERDNVWALYGKLSDTPQIVLENEKLLYIPNLAYGTMLQHDCIQYVYIT